MPYWREHSTRSTTINAAIEENLHPKGIRTTFPPIFYLTLAALAFGILSGLRWPNIWAMTHLLFDYSAGFIRRGLLGEILYHCLGHRISYLPLAAFSFAVFISWIALLFGSISISARKDLRIWIVAAIFFLSPGFAFLVHTVGYFDHLALLVTLVCFLLPAGWAGWVGRLALCSFMILVHEGFFLMFFPVIALEYCLRSPSITACRAFLPAAFLIAAVACITYFAATASIPKEKEDAYVQHVEGRADSFQIRKDAVLVVFNTMEDRWSAFGRIWSDPRRFAGAILALITVLPATFSISLLSIILLQNMQLSIPTRRTLCAAVAVAPLTPIALNIFGWDLWRFLSLTQTCALLVLLAVSRVAHGPLFPPAWQSASYYIAIVLAVLGASTSVPVFDGYVLAKPPFISHFKYIADSIFGNSPWLQIPRH